MALLPAAMVIAGLGLLTLGGDVLLRGAVGLARRFELSPLIIGLTVVAAATSMPELVVTLTSGLKGVADVGVGNAVGSNVANILLILGVAALLAPIRTRPRHIKRDGAAVLATTLAFTCLALFAPFGRPAGVAMIALLVAYLVYCYRADRREQARPAAAEDEGSQRDASGQGPVSLAKGSLLVALGVAALVIGSKLLVEGGVEVARALGVSDAVIGLTLVAVGTSLPELATAVVAGLRGHSEIALGNVLGSNLFNILGILGALALVTPFSVAPEMLRFDVWIMIGSSLLLLPIMLTGWRIDRREGFLLLLVYAAYVALHFNRGLAMG